MASGGTSRRASARTTRAWRFRRHARSPGTFTTSGAQARERQRGNFFGALFPSPKPFFCALSPPPIWKRIERERERNSKKEAEKERGARRDVLVFEYFFETAEPFFYFIMFFPPPPNRRKNVFLLSPFLPS